MRASAIDTSRWITVYHGHQDQITKDHNGKFFATDLDFAKEYGPVSTYEIRLGNVIDTTDAWVARNCIVPLNIEDPYDGSPVTFEYWENFSSETWEMTEHHLDDIKHLWEKLTGKQADTILITEGGATNYIVLDTSNMRKVKEPSSEELTEAADDQETIAGLKQKYIEFNDKYFSGQLPIIPIRWGSMKIAGAAVNYKVYGSRKHHPTMKRHLVPDSIEMVFSNKYKREFDQLIPLLLHEMIHVYLVAVMGDVEETHGIKFMRELARVSEESGIDVPLTDTVKDLELSDPVKNIGVIVRPISNGGHSYALFSEKAILAKLNDIKTFYGTRSETEVRIVSSEIWTRKAASIPLQRNIGFKTKYWVAKPEDIIDLKANSKLIWTNVVSEDAYHGTANEFDQFDGAYVGTGDGALTFGWGIYLASDRAVAKEFTQGVIIKVETPNEDKLLLWNSPYQDQPEAVKAALARMNIEKIIEVLIRREYITEQKLEELTGSDIYGVIASAVPFRITQTREKYVKYKKRASQWLFKNGIEGIKYKDVVIGKSYNYVVFDPSSIKILEKEYVEPEEEEEEQYYDEDDDW